MVAKSVWEVRRKRKIEDCISQEYGDEIFKPSSWRNAEELPHRRHVIPSQAPLSPTVADTSNLYDGPNSPDNALHKIKIQAHEVCGAWRDNGSRSFPKEGNDGHGVITIEAQIAC